MSETTDADSVVPDPARKRGVSWRLDPLESRAFNLAVVGAVVATGVGAFVASGVNLFWVGNTLLSDGALGVSIPLAIDGGLIAATASAAVKKARGASAALPVVAIVVLSIVSGLLNATKALMLLPAGSSWGVAAAAVLAAVAPVAAVLLACEVLVSLVVRSDGTKAQRRARAAAVDAGLPVPVAGGGVRRGLPRDPEAREAALAEVDALWADPTMTLARAIEVTGLTSHAVQVSRARVRGVQRRGAAKRR